MQMFNFSVCCIYFCWFFFLFRLLLFLLLCYIFLCQDNTDKAMQTNWELNGKKYIFQYKHWLIWTTDWYAEKKQHFEKERWAHIYIPDPNKCKHNIQINLRDANKKINCFQIVEMRDYGQTWMGVLFYSHSKNRHRKIEKKQRFETQIYSSFFFGFHHKTYCIWNWLALRDMPAAYTVRICWYKCVTHTKVMKFTSPGLSGCRLRRWFESSIIH